MRSAEPGPPQLVLIDRKLRFHVALLEAAFSQDLPVALEEIVDRLDARPDRTERPVLVQILDRHPAAACSAKRSFTRSSLAWQSHADAITVIKDHINTVGRQLVKLEAVRENASPWQRTAMDRTRPILKELASDTASIVDYLTNHPERLKLPAYQDYLEANADHSEGLAALISDFVNYGRNKGRMEHLKDKLEIPSE